MEKLSQSSIHNNSIQYPVSMKLRIVKDDGLFESYLMHDSKDLTDKSPFNETVEEEGKMP